MASQYTILIRNGSDTAQSFYVFQKQAEFQDPNPVEAPLTNSLGSRSLAPYASSGAQLNVSFDTQIFAGATSTLTSSPTATAAKTTQARAVVTQSEASQPIAPTVSPTDTTAKNQTLLGLYPLSLSVPVNVPNANVGYFAIQVPTFTPSPVPQVYCGCATRDSSGVVTLSSYISPTPNATLLCKVEPTYYVKVGNQPLGTPIQYDTTNAAACLFSWGVTTIIVTYNRDGTFSTQITS